MQQAQDRQAKLVVHKSRPHPFESGQRVLLFSKTIRLRFMGAPKRQPVWLGPF